MTILLLRDPEAFAQRAWDFLEARIECNILATVLSAVRSGALAGAEVPRRGGGGALFACVLDGSGRIQGAALRTPPRPMLASPLDPNAAEELIGTWMAEDPGLDAVNAVASTARALAAAWARRTGGRTDTQMRMAMHALESVTDPPRLASGRLVPVAAGQLDCALFTDLANSTSNKIYAEVGYRALDQWETISLGPRDQAVSAQAKGTSRADDERPT